MRMKEGDGGPGGRIEKRGDRLTPRLLFVCARSIVSCVPVILASGGGLFVGGASICRRPRRHDPRACAGGIGEQQTDRAVWTVRPPGGMWHDGRRKSRNAYTDGFA